MGYTIKNITIFEKMFRSIRNRALYILQKDCKNNE